MPDTGLQEVDSLNHSPRKLSHYDYGASTMHACQYDKRFSYCTYIPANYGQPHHAAYRLAVIVHGTGRTAQHYRDLFADFAEETNTIILAPLFPAGITEPGELDSYKYVHFAGIRFDLALLSMVDEVAGKYGINADRFLLHGFSGGGQFAHRFFYLHANRLLGVSIGAPGYITYLDTSRPWHVGTGNFEQYYGVPVQLEDMRNVPVQLIIGSEDVETWEINNKDEPLWMDGIDAAGLTRLERIRALRDNYEREGLSVQYDEVPGVRHEGFKLLSPVKRFFSNILTHHSR
ncbi:alpha/beta hydrolase [Paenibacillus validus]|uniref:Alpha/beta hydrolase n=1 Tax=Paenibacillus validus TaxID=44253 RepID=A0A7X2ZBE8_9BACL|nr:alpha/beta hydrolase [Paenibacillus validus]